MDYTSHGVAYTRPFRSDLSATTFISLAVHTGSAKVRIRDHWSLFSRLHKQVVVEIQVITNLGSNSKGDESYYLYYLGCCAQTMFCTCLVLSGPLLP